MAVMIPAVLPRSAPPGERDVFQKLRDDPATTDWIVLHSLDIANHATQVSGEADFVIIVPSEGILVLEVKSHDRIHRGENGLWYFGNSAEPEARGPFKQASDAMHSLRKRLVEECPDLRGVPFGHCVVFPKASGRVVTGEWHPWQFIDSGRYQSAPLPNLLLHTLQKERTFLQEHGLASLNGESPKPGDARRIAAVFRPVFEAYQSPAARAKLLQAEILQFTSEQAEVLDMIGDNPRVVIHGPAGTGKTMLALESARRAVTSGARAAVFCYNRLLGHQLGRLCKGEIKLPGGSVHRFMCEVAQLKPPPDADSYWWGTTLPELAVRRMIENNTPPYFDEIVLDEFQDILSPPILDFIDLIVVGGLAKGRWRAFGDFDRQSIYRSDQAISLQDFQATRASSLTKARLTVNCRNLPRVTKHIEKLGQLVPAYTRVRRPDDGVDPIFRFHQSDDDQELNLRKLLLEIEASGVAKAEIVVLSPAKAGAAARIAQKDGKASILVPYDAEVRDRVRFCTIHAFKGLEATAIVLTDIDDVTTREASDLFYIGMSRTLQRLGICASAKVALQLLKISNA